MKEIRDNIAVCIYCNSELELLTSNSTGLLLCKKCNRCWSNINKSELNNTLCKYCNSTLYVNCPEFYNSYVGGAAICSNPYCPGYSTYHRISDDLTVVGYNDKIVYEFLITKEHFSKEFLAFRQLVIDRFTPPHAPESPGHDLRN